ILRICVLYFKNGVRRTPTLSAHAWRGNFLSAERHRYLLAAALDRDAPLPAAGIGDALQIGRLGDLLAIHRNDDIAFLESDRLRRRAVGDGGDDDAFGLRIEAELIGQGWRQGRDRGAEERRLDADLHFVARRVG